LSRFNCTLYNKFTNYETHQNCLLNEVPPWIKLILFISLPKTNSNLFDGFVEGNYLLQAYGNHPNLMQQPDPKAPKQVGLDAVYDLAHIPVELDNFNTLTDRAVVEAKIFRRSTEAPWQFCPLMAASQENTLDGLTKLPDETQEKIDAIVRAKSNATKTPRSGRQLLSARREDVLEENREDKLTVYPMLNHTWKPIPRHLHVIILHGKIIADKHFYGGTNLQLTLTPSENSHTFPDKPSKIVPKSAPFWGESFQFRGIKKEAKEFAIMAKLFVSSGTQPGSFLSQSKLFLKEVFLDSALAGCTNVDRIVTFKPTEKKAKKAAMDVHFRFIAY